MESTLFCSEKSDGVYIDPLCKIRLCCVVFRLRRVSLLDTQIAMSIINVWQILM